MKHKVNRVGVVAVYCMGLSLLICCLSCKRLTSDKTAVTGVDLQITRFEEDLFSINIYDLTDSISYLKNKYPDFFPLYAAKILEIGNTDEEIAFGLHAFVTDFTIYNVHRRVQEVFPNLEVQEDELSAAFGKYKAHFPGYPVPHVYSCISGFNQSVVTSDSLLSISLDKYLGSDDEFYKLLYPPVPAYIRYLMKPEKISSDAVLAWIVTEFPYHDEKDMMLSRMIYHGRAWYCVQKLLPHLSDTLLFGFTKKQLDFCLAHEKRMWEYLVENKLLFITDDFSINKFIKEAPFTQDFSRESPGRAAVWLACRIVDSYMKKNRNITLLDLMQETDYQKIMNLSRYNP